MEFGALGMKTEIDGFGSGSGGYGFGFGYGYGSGSGYGNGSSYGDGGFGCGYGSGYGNGGDKEKTDYLNLILKSHNRPNCTMAFWRSDKNGKPANGGGGGPRSVGMVEDISGPLNICTEGALHGTVDPSKWKGARWWVVALHEPVQRQDDKIASLKREIVADLGKCPF